MDDDWVESTLNAIKEAIAREYNEVGLAEMYNDFSYHYREKERCYKCTE